MTRRRAIIVVEFNLHSKLDRHQEYNTLAAIDDHMARVADDIRHNYTDQGLTVTTSVGAVVDTLPRNSKSVTVKDLNKVTFRGTGTKHKIKNGEV